MNIHPKFSHADQLGVLGLLAFLADPEACRVRMNELQAAAQAADDAGADAKIAQEKAQGVIDESAKRLAEAQAAENKAASVEEAARKAQGVAANKLAEVEKREAALKEAQAKADARDREQAAHSQDLDLRERKIAEKEDALASARAELDRKLSQLRSLAQ